jgi:hypothetical protein
MGAERGQAQSSLCPRDEAPEAIELARASVGELESCELPLPEVNGSSGEPLWLQNRSEE